MFKEIYKIFMEHYLAEWSMLFEKAAFPHHRLGELIFQRPGQGGHLDEWEDRVRKLDRADGLEDLIKMKCWTEQIAAASGEVSLRRVYPFDKNRLHPIRLRK